MPAIGNIEIPVIYVILADQNPQLQFDDNGFFNGNNSTSRSIQRYFYEMSNQNLNLSFNIHTYGDTTTMSYYRLVHPTANPGFIDEVDLKYSMTTLTDKALNNVQAQNPNISFSSHIVNGIPYIANIVIMLNRDFAPTQRITRFDWADSPLHYFAIINNNVVNYR